MPTAHDFLETATSVLGVSPSKVRNIGAALLAGEVWPVSYSRGRRPEHLNARNVADFFIALGINEPLRNIAKATRVYSALRDPAGNQAGEVIGRYIDALSKAPGLFERREATPELAVAALAYQSRIVIEADFPTVTVVNETKDGGPLETVFGPIQDRPSSFVRVIRSATISGKLLYDLAKTLNCPNATKYFKG